jgi:hypothetical protein
MTEEPMANVFNHKRGTREYLVYILEQSEGEGGSPEPADVDLDGAEILFRFELRNGAVVEVVGEVLSNTVDERSVQGPLLENTFNLITFGQAEKSQFAEYEVIITPAGEGPIVWPKLKRERIQIWKNIAAPIP